MCSIKIETILWEKSMKKTILIWTAMASSGLGLAQEIGTVTSAIPVIHQVQVPRRVCSNEQVMVQPQKSGAGAAMGAIAGGAIGNSVGRGSGQTAATVLGLLGGAVLGDKIEGAPSSQLQNMQQCSTQIFYENRTMGYNVTYEFLGKQYSVQMPSDPGPTIQLQITPMLPRR
ncbi:MAG: glycine zipper 2TM domain-containing protein [Burkholderiaceae bacterium]